MKMKIIVASLCVASVICFAACSSYNNEDTTTSEANIPSETEVYLTLEETDNIDTMRSYVSICEEDKEKAHNMAEIARDLGYSDDHIIIQFAKARYSNSLDLQNKYQAKINVIEEEIRKQEAERLKREEEKRKREEEQRKKELEAQNSGTYPAATQVWNIMKSYGWSDIICAGIMGNMMRECGGDTLNLNPYAGSSHYGLCQWSKTYHGGAWGKDIPGQLEYLRNTLDINIFNGCGSPEAAAEIFCWNYERPAKSDPVHKRIANARVAYNCYVN